MENVNNKRPAGKKKTAQKMLRKQIQKNLKMRKA